MTARLIPDLDDELTAALARLEELLLEVAAWEEDDPDTAWPAPLACRQVLEAVQRIWDAVAPTQGERAVAAGLTGRLLAPDGRYEHAPLRLADVGQADVAALAAAAAVFGDPHAPGHVRQALEHGADIAYRRDDDQACTRLVMAAAQLAGLLDLAPDRDSEMLAALVEDSGPGGDVVLSPRARPPTSGTPPVPTAHGRAVTRWPATCTDPRRTKPDDPLVRRRHHRPRPLGT